MIRSGIPQFSRRRYVDEERSTGPIRVIETENTAITREFTFEAGTAHPAREHRRAEREPSRRNPTFQAVWCIAAAVSGTLAARCQSPPSANSLQSYHCKLDRSRSNVFFRRRIRSVESICDLSAQPSTDGSPCSDRIPFARIRPLTGSAARNVPGCRMIYYPS